MAESDPSSPPEEKFQPRGAFAFFLMLLVLNAVIWFTVYFIMLKRS